MNRSVSKERIMSWIVGFMGSASSTLDVDGIIGLIFEKNSIKKKRRYNAAPKALVEGATSTLKEIGLTMREILKDGTLLDEG